MEQVQVQVLESPREKIECRICGIQECDKCIKEIKKEKISASIFISGTSIGMIGLSFLSSPASLAFIGLGLSCGTVLKLLYRLTLNDI